VGVQGGRAYQKQKAGRRIEQTRERGMGGRCRWCRQLATFAICLEENPLRNLRLVLQSEGSPYFVNQFYANAWINGIHCSLYIDKRPIAIQAEFSSTSFGPCWLSFEMNTVFSHTGCSISPPQMLLFLFPNFTQYHSWDGVFVRLFQ